MGFRALLPIAATGPWLWLSGMGWDPTRHRCNLTAGGSAPIPPSRSCRQRVVRPCGPYWWALPKGRGLPPPQSPLLGGQPKLGADTPEK